MSLAQAAFLAARNADAYKFAPQIYRSAEENYLKAKSAYRRKYFNKAQEYAILSRRFSEKAEYISQKKKVLTGDEKL